MANKSPAELKNEGVELKAVLAKVKKKQHNCAMLMSKDGIVLEVHLKKSPEVLVKTAKKAGGTAKGVWGTITIEGQVVIIDPINEKIPGSLTKVAKKFFSERGLKNRLEIKEPDEDAAASEEAEAEEEDVTTARESEPEAEVEAPATEVSEDDSTPENSRAAQEDGPAGGGEETDPRTVLEQKLDALQSRIDELLADTGNVMMGMFEDTMSTFTRSMDDGLFDRANEALANVESVLDDYNEIMAEKRPFLDRMSAMTRGIAKVVSGADDTAASAIALLQREFENAVENSQWFSSGEKLDQIESMIGETEDADDEPEEDEEDYAAAETEEGSTAETQEPEEDEDSDVAENEGDERGRLVDIFKGLTSDIKTALKSDDKGVVKKVATLAKGFAAAVKSGDLTKGQKIIDLLEPMVAQNSESGEAAAGQQAGESAEPAEAEAKAQAKGNRLNQLKQMRTRIQSLFKEMQQ